MSPPLLLLHGFALGPALFDGLRAHLPADREVIAPFLPGHGELPAAAEFDDAVDQIAAALPVGEPVELLGYSLGARLATGLLLRHPQRITRAILIGARPGLPAGAKRAARARWERAWSVRLRDEGIEAFVRAWERLPVFADQPEAERAQLRRLRRAHDPERLARAMETMGLAAMPDLLPELGEISAPCLLVTGEHDPDFGEQARQMAAVIPRARAVVIPGCGHNPLLACAEQIARLVLHTDDPQHPFRPATHEAGGASP